MRHPRQIIGAALFIFSPQGQTDNWHIVNALGFNNWLPHAQMRRQPIRIGIQLVIQPDNGVSARLTYQKLHSQHCQTRPGHRIDMFHPFDFRQHLLGGTAHQSLHFPGGRTRKRDEHIGERHIDLRLFFAGRDQYRKQTHQ